MSRKIAGQVATNVSRLLKGNYLKSEPVWLQSVIAHPPAPPQPRSPIARPADDLPPSYVARQKHFVNLATQPSTKRRTSVKRLRSLTPTLDPKPIYYLQDRVRRQFFRDHPWEAYRPRILVEMDKTVVIDKSSPLGAPQDARELRAWGRNPQPEDVVSCTIHLHQNHGLSLSQAYHHTIASYHALRAEHETASRFAVLEAEAYGAKFDTTESTHAFRREQRRIFGPDYVEPEEVIPLSGGANASSSSASTSSRDKAPPVMISVKDSTPVEALSSPLMRNLSKGAAGPMVVEPRGKDRARRIKNVDETFTEGDRYLEAAISTSQAVMARLRSS
ncbi:mitochondrial ribosomal small subunit component [Tilletia horrida]|uniref:Small ribosomal subunit protein mS23 n=1 Tax=Tilletia horrida TaxID=155126 RepID=A0AAN6GQF3_9BASI|nr:mitochondrial ribosomal small subunit component [Tilletia horrida]